MPSLKARDNPHRADNNDTRNPAGAEDSSEEKDMRNLKNIKMRRGEERRGEKRRGEERRGEERRGEERRGERMKAKPS